MSHRFGLAAVTLIALGLSVMSPSTAMAIGAPELPANQHLFVVDCGSFQPQLWSVDSTSGDSTAVGDFPTDTTHCSLGGQTNPADGKPYFITYSGTVYLTTVDTASGLVSKVVDFSGDQSFLWDIQFTNSGEAFATTSSSLYTLDLSTGETTLVGDFGVGLQTVGYSPKTDTLYGYSPLSGVAYTIDRSTGVATAVPEHNLVLPANYTCPDGTTHGLFVNHVVFDANGNPWFQNETCTSTLLVQDFSTGTVYYQGQFNDTAQSLYSNSPYYQFYTSAIFITTDVAPAELPATGALTEPGVTLGAVSAVGIGLGAIVIGVIRRRRLS